ncbi:potassium channel family protein [Butyrivibrio sp. INlla16]|uniref:potassium channel family protein n=1 Tax=Butyrivibrio sp. INlla16 TaxID=1520807 RepID=UPI00087F4A33|nr:potassium channel family protein [Butyrivibrio sp. INlla16]SDB42797.1 Ion channel [Butyrivibrio sp. INlla16]
MNNKKSFKDRINDLKLTHAVNKGSGGSVFRRMFFMIRRYIRILLGFIAAYLALLFLLVEIERRDPSATIHNIGEAFWYSLVTLTTIGYGDFYPVTPAGRLIASVFVILGIGLLGFFVGFMMEFVSRIKPIILLSIHTAKPWYIFTDKSQYSMIFAENIKAVRPDAVIIYSGCQDDGKGSKAISVQWSAAELLERRGSLYDAHIMCLKDNEMENFLDAITLSDTGAPIVCLANFTPAHHPMNISFFSLTDCTARLFWQQYPVKKKNETILLIGFGAAGSVLLDRALELNVLYEDQSIHYHVFGNSDEYCRNRKKLSDIVSINEQSDERDSIIFHDSHWNTDEKLLAKADRIILCDDSEKDNIAVLQTLQKFFAFSGEIYIYNSNVRSIATPFGQTRDILTPAFVLHNTLTDMALCRHEMMRFYLGGAIPLWEDLDSLIKDMNYITTDHISLKVHMLLGDEAPCQPFDDIPSATLRKASAARNDMSDEQKTVLNKLEHERTCRFYLLHNYSYAEKTNDDTRENNLLKTFDKLNDFEKQMVEISWNLIDELASHKAAKGR